MNRLNALLLALAAGTLALGSAPRTLPSTAPIQSSEGSRGLKRTFGAKGDRRALTDQHAQEQIDRSIQFDAAKPAVNLEMPDAAPKPPNRADQDGALVGVLLDPPQRTAVDAKNSALADSASSAAGDGDDLITVRQSLLGAKTRTQHDKNAETVSVKDFGAKGDGITDDTAAIQAAIKAVAPGTLHIPIGTYKTTSPLVLVSGIKLVGSGYGAANQSPTGSSTIQNGTSDLFTNGSTPLVGMLFDGVTLQSLAGGGHLFNFSGAGAITNNEWRNVVMIQNNANKSVIHAPTSGGFFANWFHHFGFSYAASNSAPAFNLANPYLSHVVIEDFYSFGNNTAAGTYAIWLEGTRGTAGYACSIRQGVFERPGGGAINVLSCVSSSISECVEWDLTVVPANPFINIGKSATTSAGSQLSLPGIRATAGSSAHPDLKIDTTNASVSLDSCTLSYIDGISPANVMQFRNCFITNLANMRWSAENSYVTSASLILGTYAYAFGYNNTVSFQVDISGNVVTSSNGSGTVKAGSLTQGALNATASLNGNRSASDPGSDCDSNSQVARKAGYLHQFKNFGAAVAGVNYSGGLQPGQLNAGGLANSSTIYSGAGAPSNAHGSNGDFYLRSDTPSTSTQRLYVKSAGTWVGIL